MEPMSVIDVDKLLQEISAETPCGADLGYDPTFQELIRAAQGRPERRMGDSIAPAEEPDWGQVRKLALSLLARSKDLRVALYLTRALLDTHGYAWHQNNVNGTGAFKFVEHQPGAFVDGQAFQGFAPETDISAEILVVGQAHDGVGQGGLARPGDPGNAAEGAHRNGDVDLTQVVVGDPPELEPLPISGHGAALWHTSRSFESLGCHRAAHRGQLPLSDDSPAVLPAARTDIDDMVSRSNRVCIVIDDQD